MSASPAPEASTSTLPEHNGPSTVYDNVFGREGSELSDSESETEFVPKRNAFPPRPTAALTANDDDDDDDDEDEEEDNIRPMGADSDDDEDVPGDEAYVPATMESAAKIPKFKKRRVDDGDVDMDEGGGGEDRVKEKRKKKKKHRGERKRDRGDGDRQEGQEVEEEEGPVLDPDTQRRIELEAKIDAIGKKAKTTKRKKKDDVDVVDTYHDEICARLRERMMHAVDRDRVSNANGMPATAKLAMLDEVMGVLRNATLWTSVVDNGVLDAVRAWLEPTGPAGALPAVGIQNALFEILPKMDLDTPTLKECRLGPLVLFYTKTKRVTPAINRAADGLVQAWSRPIIKRPNDLRSRHVDTADDLPEGGGVRGGSGGGGGGGQASQASQGAAIGERRRRFDTATAIRENHGRKGARMPQIRETQYTVAPESRTMQHADDKAHADRVTNDNKKFNKFARQLRMNKAR